jgi:hypothetical protein
MFKNTKIIMLLVVGLTTIIQADFLRIESKEVVIDTSRGLMWQDELNNKIVKSNWKDAVSYCDNSSFANYDDWTLPTERQLYTIIDKNNTPKVNISFKNTIAQHYWASSSYKNDKKYAWYVSYDKIISANSSLKSRIKYVRCVRDGNYFDTLSLESKNKIKNSFEKNIFETKIQYTKRLKKWKMILEGRYLMINYNAETNIMRFGLGKDLISLCKKHNYDIKVPAEHAKKFFEVNRLIKIKTKFGFKFENGEPIIYIKNLLN